MRGFRVRGFRVAVIGVTATIVAVFAAAVAVMAIGAPTDSPIPPASTTWKVMPSVSPTGGQNTDCTVFGSAAPYWYRIDNPQNLPNGYSTTALDGTSVNFKLTIDTSGPKKDKSFLWTSTNATVYDVGVKGGSDTAHYGYTRDKNGDLPPTYTTTGWTNLLKPVFGDTALHATLDNQGKPYNLSNITFCYGTSSVISGTVFDDADADTVKDTGEPGLQGRTVRLYAGAATATSTTATTDADGNYSFTGAVGQSYRVCLVAAAGRKQTLAGTSASWPRQVASRRSPGPQPATRRRPRTSVLSGTPSRP
jgi:hypothetical protein